MTVQTEESFGTLVHSAFAKERKADNDEIPKTSSLLFGPSFQRFCNFRPKSHRVNNFEVHNLIVKILKNIKELT